GPADLLTASMGVGDAPVTGFQLHRLGALVGDGDGVGPEEITVLGRGAIGDEPRRHHDFDIARHGAIEVSATAVLRQTLVFATTRDASAVHVSSSCGSLAGAKVSGT